MELEVNTIVVSREVSVYERLAQVKFQKKIKSVKEEEGEEQKAPEK